MKLLLLVILSAGAVLANQEFVGGEFFLGLKPETSIDAYTQILAHEYNLEVVRSHEFKRVKLLFVKGSETDVIRASALSVVTFWERNLIAHTSQCSEGSASTCWGLDRIDQLGGLSYDTPLEPSATYNWGSDDGAGVVAYIVDSGVLHTHEDFGNRASFDYAAPGLPGSDGNGHGTHCAGTTGGTTMGVAKEVTISAVQVMNALGAGTLGDIVLGLNFVNEDHIGRGANAKSVINLSLGTSSISDTMDAALQECIDSGVTAAVASGNSDEDACNSSPGHMLTAISVGASDVSDVSASFSNFGTCLDLYAPGVDVRSTWRDGGYNTISGTSMATPHVCGAVARYMSSQSTAPSPAAVETFMVNSASANQLTLRVGHGSSPNLLLRTNCPM